jgi:hypothetical protein
LVRLVVLPKKRIQILKLSLKSGSTIELRVPAIGVGGTGVGGNLFIFDNSSIGLSSSGPAITLPKPVLSCWESPPMSRLIGMEESLPASLGEAR